MRVLEEKKLLVQRKYIAGWHGDECAQRKYEHELTLDGNEDFKDIYYSELNTPKDNGVWGEGKITYYWDANSELFDNQMDLIKSKYKLI